MNYTALFKAAIVFLIVLSSLIGSYYLFTHYPTATGIGIISALLMCIFKVVYSYFDEND